MGSRSPRFPTRPMISLFFGVLAAPRGEESVPEGAGDEHDDDDDPEGEVARKTKERSTALLSQRGIRDGREGHGAGSLGAPGPAGGALGFGSGWSARLTGGDRDGDGVRIAKVSPMDGARDGSRDGSRDGKGMTMLLGPRLDFGDCRGSRVDGLGVTLTLEEPMATTTTSSGILGKMGPERLYVISNISCSRRNELYDPSGSELVNIEEY